MAETRHKRRKVNESINQSICKKEILIDVTTIVDPRISLMIFDHIDFLPMK